MILLHLALLGTAVLFALVCIAARFGKTPRPASAIINALAPLIVVGLLVSLVLSANGQPRTEWIIPTLAVIAVGLFCRSEKLFQIVRWGMLVLAVGLCVNFLNLVQGDGYTAEPSRSKSLAHQNQKVAVKKAGKSIRKDHDPADVLPEGPVGSVDHIEVISEWHTPLTGIYKVRHSEAAIWYPGGPVSEAADDLTIADGE